MGLVGLIGFRVLVLLGSGLMVLVLRCYDWSWLVDSAPDQVWGYACWFSSQRYHRLPFCTVSGKQAKTLYHDPWQGFGVCSCLRSSFRCISRGSWWGRVYFLLKRENLIAWSPTKPETQDQYLKPKKNGRLWSLYYRDWKGAHHLLAFIGYISPKAVGFGILLLNPSPQT